MCAVLMLWAPDPALELQQGRHDSLVQLCYKYSETHLWDRMQKAAAQQQQRAAHSRPAPPMQAPHGRFGWRPRCHWRRCHKHLCCLALLSLSEALAHMRMAWTLALTLVLLVACCLSLLCCAPPRLPCLSPLQARAHSVSQPDGLAALRLQSCLACALAPLTYHQHPLSRPQSTVPRCCLLSCLLLAHKRKPSLQQLLVFASHLSSARGCLCQLLFGRACCHLKTPELQLTLMLKPAL